MFVEELDGVPDGRPVVFSAHGVPKSVPRGGAPARDDYLDATCPLVSKVHARPSGISPPAAQILLIGHAGHPEVVGTMGQLPPGAMTLIQNAEEARHVRAAPTGDLAFVTQTTLSLDDTAEIVAVLRARFPAIGGPKEDICYATTNRQEAVKAIAARCDLVLVIGSPNSSNSQRLREVAERSGARRALLLPRPEMLDWSVLEGVRDAGHHRRRLGARGTGGGAAGRLARRYALAIEERRVVDEDVVFRLPAPLA